ncbi:hypothetical protein [Flagellimonas sp. 2504JD4-2]
MRLELNSCKIQEVTFLKFLVGQINPKTKPPAQFREIYNSSIDVILPVNFGQFVLK